MKGTTMALLGALCLTASVTAQSLNDQLYQQIKQPGLDKMQLRYADLQPVLKKHANNPLFRFKQLGLSLQQRPIWQIDIGQGPIRILAWSQMHGDESTATAALADVLNFIADNPKWQQDWLSKVSIRLVPMLNPDGAEQNSRFNAAGIDINRDALQLQTPEGRLLMQTAIEFQPEFALNLHDQNPYYSAGNFPHPATISLLAPAYNEAKDINSSREKAMQLAAQLHGFLQQVLPDHTGRYDDTYSVRSFGDTFSGKGFSTVLIESGGYPDDLNRQVPRKLNAQMLVLAIESSASAGYKNFSLKDYQAIPMNGEQVFKDVLIQNIQLKQDKQHTRLDLALQLDYREDGSVDKASIKDIGDLSIYHGYKEFDAKGLWYQSPKAYALTQPLILTKALYSSLLKQGYGFFSGEQKLLQNQSGWPVLLNPTPAPMISRQHHASFLLSDEKTVQVAVILGQWIELSN